MREVDGQRQGKFAHGGYETNPSVFTDAAGENLAHAVECRLPSFPSSHPDSAPNHRKSDEGDRVKSSKLPGRDP